MTLPRAKKAASTREAKRAPSRGKQILRGIRLLLLLLVFCVTAALFHLNKAGLPDFAKTRIVDALRHSGWDAEFSRVRLRWYRGIVVENIQLHSTNRMRGLNLFVDEAQCRLDPRALLRMRVRVAGFYLHGGRALWPMMGTNAPSQSLRLEDLNGDLVLQPSGEWELRKLTAECFGARLQFSGIITNAAAIRTWDFTPRDPEKPGAFKQRWRQWVQLVNQVHFMGVPEVECHFFGDAKDLESFQGTLSIQADSMESSWVSGTNIAIRAEWFPAYPDMDPVQAELNLTSFNARTPWGQAEELKFYAHGLPSLEGWMPTNINIAVEVRQALTPWGQAAFAVVTANSMVNPTNTLERYTQFSGMMENLNTPWASGLQIQLDAAAMHPLTNMLPATVSTEVRIREASTRWGRAGFVDLEGAGVLPRDHRLADTNLVWPQRLEGLALSIGASLTNVTAKEVHADHLRFHADWTAETLGLDTSGHLADGDFDVRAKVNAGTREVTFHGSSTLDPHGIESLMTTNGQRWLQRYTWADPPRARAQGRMILPPWDESHPDWKGDVRPTLELEGEFEVGPAAYRGAEFMSARSPFTLTNLVWKMTDLRVTRPEGGITGEYESQLVDRDFHWRLDARIFPQTFAPLLDGPRQQHALNLMRFAGAPQFQGEIHGNWKDLDALSFSGHVFATNFMFRGEPVEYVEGDVEMRDQKISVYKPKGRRVENETAAASGLMMDLRTQKLYLTNVFARVSAGPATRIISDQAFRTMEPYVFETPAVVHAEGIVDVMKGRQEYDLKFEITGGPFHWRDFQFEDIAGNLHWLNETLLMTNMTGGFHQGRAWGDAFFDFSVAQGADFSFQSRLTNVNFHTFTSDLSHRTNNLDGIFSGLLIVTNAQTADWKSWQGYGNVYLEDGLIWDIPVFGVFSPILNTIAPGMGNSRARSATASYTITNSVIHTDDLAVNATAMRMQFRGVSDFDRNVRGRMEAELLRNMPGVGLIISKVLWPVTKLFEYKITGTVQNPQTEPVYIFPKIILLPLNPIKSLRDIFLETGGTPRNQPSPGLEK